MTVFICFIFNFIGAVSSPRENSKQDVLAGSADQYSSVILNLSPLISNGGRIVLPLMTWGHRTRLSHALTRAGITQLDHHHFFFLQFLSSIICLVIGIVILILVFSRTDLSMANVSCVMTTGLIGFLLPGCWLSAKANSRREDILRTLPFFLDMLALGLNAGMSLQSALQLTLKHLEPGPLKTEWTKFLLDVRSGFSRAQALRQLSNRIEVSAVRQLVAALIQGESMGLSLTRTVLEYARQLRTMRLLHAEKLAFQAPVKMLFPLAFCIFPCTFLILGFPVVAQAMGWE